MATKVEVWNVGHGDAIRINFEDKFYIIRDFGRSLSAQRTGTSVDVNYLINHNFATPGVPTDAVLSHPHYDHFSGFMELSRLGRNNIFNYSYMPWLDFRTIQSLGWQMSILSAYLYAYFGPTRIDNSIDNWTKAAPLMACLSHYFFGVSAGHQFNWPKPATVLWPPPPCPVAVISDEARQVSNWIDILERALREEQAESEEYIYKTRESGKEIAKILSKYYQLEPLTIENPQKDLAELEKIRYRLAAINIPRTIRMEAVHDVAWQHFFKNVDNHSIVFEIDGNALFLSDLHPGPMNTMAKNYMSVPRSYKLLKSSHHGTRLGKIEFVRSINATDKIIHNCGPANSRFGGPISEYCKFNPAHIYYTDIHPKARNLPAPFTMQIFPTTNMSITI
ncbi:MAG: hypothetical protein K9K65_14100 [Desulfarculaceae bacterium]|nr:hypothetical protein [Desulfarculaceae bacterium]MCF8098969.1 hypothetical protein [Desulfarculaceae bacterium]MCF8121819.1 hypothetical protein [Desulfarculaceae bacterium]